MRNKLLLILVLAAVATCAIATPAQASSQGRNNTAIGIGAFCLGTLLSGMFRQPEPRYVERETVVVPQRTVVYRQPVRYVRYNRVYRTAPVQYESVVDYYQY